MKHNILKGKINMTYRCPACGEIFHEQVERCPKCQRKMKYLKHEETALPEVKKESPEKVSAKQEVLHEEPLTETKQKSYFDGGLLQLIGWRILGFLVTIVTLGICYPLAVCMIYNWQTKHTVIEGRRLAFDGRAIQLFGNWIKWFLLTIITLGIFSLWIPIKIKKWVTKHTYFAE